MSAFNPAIDDYDDPYEQCPACGCEMDWEECGECGGEGYQEMYELDPLWYDEDDVEPCNTCEGAGGWWVCSNTHGPPLLAKTLLAAVCAALREGAAS